MTDYHVWCHFFFNSTNRCQFGRNHYSIHTTLTLFSLALPESFVCFVVSTSVTSTLWLCTTSCCPTKSDRLLSNMNKTINNVAIRINATYNDEFRFQCVVIFTQNCLILFKFLFFLLTAFGLAQAFLCSLQLCPRANAKIVDHPRHFSWETESHPLASLTSDGWNFMYDMRSMRFFWQPSLLAIFHFKNWKPMTMSEARPLAQRDHFPLFARILFICLLDWHFYVASLVRLASIQLYEYRWITEKNAEIILVISLMFFFFDSQSPRSRKCRLFVFLF